ncbi:MAG: asparagine--tRNA ligase [Acidobacteriota bacterium]
MPPVIALRDISRYEGRDVSVRGWLYHRRSAGKLEFLIVRDGSGYVQVVAFEKDLPPEVFETCRRLTQESSLIVSGPVRRDERSPWGYEIGLRDLEVVHLAEEYPIGPKEHGVAFLMEHRHLWLRSSKQHAVLRVRSEASLACREFLHSEGFTCVDSPILTPTSCEGTSTLFETDYFGSKAFLSQSGQLYQESACMVFGRTYCFGPTFRAEKSKTRRHLTEFWMLEPEMAFATLDDAIELAERLCCAVVERVLDRNREDLKRLERDTSRLEQLRAPFPRLTYEQALHRLKEHNVDVPWGDDFGGDDETVLASIEEIPIVVHRYPATLKPFYMQPDPEDSRLVLNFDLMAPEGHGEIIGGSQRIHDEDLLRKQMRAEGLDEAAFRWYLEIRRFGTVPHSGFGLGIERLVGWITGILHLREAIPFPRTLNRLYP